MKKFCSALLAAALAFTLAAPAASALELEDAKALLAQYYVDGVPEEILELDSLDAILEALGDPYTVYMPPSDYEEFIDSINGQVVVGIGATVEVAFQDGYQIMSVLPGSPALEVGIQAGDRIIDVDGVPLTAEIDPRVPITGEEGTQVTLTIVRDGQQLEFTVTRRAVTIPIVTYQMVDGAAYIDIDSFGATTSADVKEAIQALDSQTAVWIVDLLNNPGGDSGATALTAGHFTGGQVMLYFRDGGGNYRYTYLLPTYPDLTDKPVIVLTSAYSASGSELFAGDIRDYQAGIAVGQRTFGKGIAQLVFDESNTDVMSDGEALKITVYRFFSPSGTTNHITGVLPTLLISPENTQAAALLLAQAKPGRAAGYWKLEVAGQTFYLNPTSAAKESPDALTELLEALPPSAQLYKGSGTQVWTEISPAQAAADCGLSFTARAFSDVEDSPFRREIQTLAAYRLLTGDEHGLFRPQDAVTRAEFCAMVAAALDLPAGKSASFSDVSSGAWYANAISAMADMGFISGYGDGSFGPSDTITYQQMVTILSAVAAWASMDGYDLAQQDLPVQEWVNYVDYADWAQAPARNLDALGCLVGELAPTDLATREVAAGMLCTLMESIGLIWD